MMALDTNILARFLLNDAPEQTKMAEKLLRGKEPCTAPITVFLELIWVLGASDCNRTEIARAIRLLCGLPNFKLPYMDAIAFALHWYEGGMDFADALHLAMSSTEQSFQTFDKLFFKNSVKLGAFPEVVVPAVTQPN